MLSPSVIRKVTVSRGFQAPKGAEKKNSCVRQPLSISPLIFQTISIFLDQLIFDFVNTVVKL